MNPRLHFGKLPTIGFILGLIIIPLFILRPIVNLIIDWSQGETVEPMKTLVAGMSLSIVIMFAMFALLGNTKMTSFYHISKRVRYIRKKLVPFLEKKYNIKVNMKGASAPLVLMSEGLLEIKGKDEKFLFMGWAEIEKVAAGGTVDLPSELHIVQEHGEGAREIEPANYKEGDNLATFSPVRESASLEDTERGVSSLLFETLVSLPQGRVMISVVPPDGMDFPGLSANLQLDVDNDKNISYSNTAFTKLVEAGVFNIRLGGTSCMVIEVSHGDKRYFLGKIIYADTYQSLEVSDLHTLLGVDEQVIYIKSLDEIKNLQK